MKKLCLLLVLCSLGIFTIGCNDAAKDKTKDKPAPTDTKPADAKPADTKPAK